MDSELARAGHDPAVFEALYRRHVDAVTRFVARRVDDPHTAADLTAEVFLVVIDSAHTYRPELGTEIGWIFGVARNVMSADNGGPPARCGRPRERRGDDCSIPTTSRDWRSASTRSARHVIPTSSSQNSQTACERCSS
ncbi:MAG: sigM2 [Actinomycetia bacterium]|nr:sigM2 [Actinomycetes bacterium]